MRVGGGYAHRLVTTTLTATFIGSLPSSRGRRRSTGTSAPSDGYTFLLATSANAINATLYEKLNFNFIRDLAPVAGIVDSPLTMIVNPTFPANRFPNSLRMPKPNLARSTWLRRASGARLMWPVSYLK
jgi:tripartite-type tricarboxylate transporter receptor subunit TctC